MFSYGTLCSGCDGIAWVIYAFFTAVREFYGITVTAYHAFACEDQLTAQRFIGHFHDPGVIFKKIETMGAASAHTVSRDALRLVPDTDASFGGTSCKLFLVNECQSGGDEFVH